MVMSDKTISYDSDELRSIVKAHFDERERRDAEKLKPVFKDEIPVLKNSVREYKEGEPPVASYPHHHSLDVGVIVVSWFLNAITTVVIVVLLAVVFR